MDRVADGAQILGRFSESFIQNIERHLNGWRFRIHARLSINKRAVGGAPGAAVALVLVARLVLGLVGTPALQRIRTLARPNELDEMPDHRADECDHGKKRVEQEYQRKEHDNNEEEHGASTHGACGGSLWLSADIRYT